MKGRIEDTVEALLNGPVRRLPQLPSTRGVYALLDHQGNVRYIGKAVRTDFRNRINNRHTTGSEGNSHKFSHTYNTGRLWREKRDRTRSAFLVKSLRTDFIRHFCRARVVELCGSDEEIAEMEAEAIRLAPPEAKAWNDLRLHTVDEPTDLLDQFLRENPPSNDLTAAMAQQERLFQSSSKP